VARDPVADFPGQIQAGAIILEHIDDPQTLFVMIEATRDEIAQHPLSRVTKRRVPKIMTERDLNAVIAYLRTLSDKPVPLPTASK